MSLITVTLLLFAAIAVNAFSPVPTLLRSSNIVSNFVNGKSICATAIPTCAGNRITLRAMEREGSQSDLLSLVGDEKPRVESAKSVISDKKQSDESIADAKNAFAHFDNWDAFACVGNSDAKDAFARFDNWEMASDEFSN